MIESVKPAGAVEYAAGTKSVKDAAAEGRNEADASYAVDLSGAARSNRPGADQIAQIRSQVEAANASLRALVERLLTKQGGTYRAAFQEISFDSDMSVTEAQAAISEDGYWGVNAVSDRIASFAIALSGGDASKLEELKAAIDKGFKLAGKSFGGDLPGICGDTRDAIMRKLDKWAENGGGVDARA
jgi:hypothetical protein